MLTPTPCRRRGRAIVLPELHSGELKMKTAKYANSQGPDEADQPPPPPQGPDEADHPPPPPPPPPK